MGPEITITKSSLSVKLIYSNQRRLSMHEYQVARFVALIPASDFEPEEIFQARRRFESNHEAATMLARQGIPPILDSQDFAVLRLRGEL